MNWDTIMVDDPNNEETLEALFKASRDNPVEPGPDFMARLIADADANAPKMGATPSPKKVSHWARPAQNWLAASGLTAATVLGVWIGILLPETQIADIWLTGDANEIDLTAFLPGADLSQFTDPEADG